MDRRQDPSRHPPKGGRDHRDHQPDPEPEAEAEAEQEETVPQYSLRNRKVFASPVQPKPSSSRAAAVNARPPRKNQNQQQQQLQQQQEHPSPTMLAKFLHATGRRLSTVLPSSPTAKNFSEMSVQAPTPVLARQLDKRLVSPLHRLNPNPNPFQSDQSNRNHDDQDADDDHDDDDDDEEQQDKNSPTRAQPKPKPKPKQPPTHPQATSPALRNDDNLNRMRSAAFKTNPPPAGTAASSSSASTTPLRPTNSQMQRSLRTTLKRRFSTFIQNTRDLSTAAQIILGLLSLVLVASVFFLGINPMPYAPPGALVYPSPPAFAHEHAPLSSPVSEIRVKRSEPSPPPPPAQPPSTPPTAPASPPSPQSPSQPQPQPNQDLTHLRSLLANHASTLSSLQARIDSTDKLRSSLATDLRASILAQVHQAMDAKLDDPEHVSRAASSIVAKAVTDKVAPALDELKAQIDLVKRQVDEVQGKMRAAEEERERVRARRALVAEEQQQQQQASASVSTLRDLALYTSGARVQHFLTSRTYSWPASASSTKSSSWWPFMRAAHVNAHPPEIALLSSPSPAAPEALAGKCWTSAGPRAVLTVKLARANAGAAGSASVPVQVGLAHLAQDHAIDYSVAPREVKVWAIVGDTGADQVKAVADKAQALVAMAGGAPPRVDAGMPPPLVQQQPTQHVQQPSVIPIDALDEIAPDQLAARTNAAAAPLAKVLLASFTYPAAGQNVRQGALVWTLATVPSETRAALDAAQVHVRLVAFEVVKNHGHAERSCVYRVGVFAEVPSEYPGVRDKVHV